MISSDFKMNWEHLFDNYRPGKEGGEPDALSRRIDYINSEDDETLVDENTESCLTIKEIGIEMCALAM